MKLVRKRFIDKSVAFSLSIDPGLVSTGFCLVDFSTKEVSLHTIYTKDNFISTGFVDNLVMSERQFNKYLDFIKSKGITDFSTLQINLEHSVYNPDFTFSIGLNIFLTYVVTSFSALGVNNIVLIPPKTPSFFLQTREKLRDAEIRKWVKYFIPEIVTIKESAHSIDALLHSLFIHYSFYHIEYKVKHIRVPEYELIDI